MAESTHTRESDLSAVPSSLPRINPGRNQAGSDVGRGSPDRSAALGHSPLAARSEVSQGSELTMSEISGENGLTPKGRHHSRAELPSESPRSDMSDSPSYGRKYFGRRGGSSFEPSEASSSVGMSPRLSLNFSPRHAPTSTYSGATPRQSSRASTPTRSRRDRVHSGKSGKNTDYGNGIPAVNGGLVLVTDDMIQNIAKKKGMLPPEEEPEVYAVSGDKIEIPDDQKATHTQMNWIGVLLFLFYLGTAIYYFVIRATKTLNMGYPVYGILVLGVEIIASTATIGYGVLLTRWTRTRRTRGLPISKPGVLLDENNLHFHVRVLIPVYKESVDLVTITVTAALKAPLPARTKRTVYLCDDGNDPAKREMLESLQGSKDCVYVSGRKRDPDGETNGKSNNLNNCLNLIYGDAPKINKNELIIIFDADMVAKPNFFCKVLEVMQDDDIALCLTPQGFNNCNAQGDIFNNLNLSFWEYMLPGCDALGYIACTGTNFCLRVEPLRDCGWFPNFTITEDYALGMELRKRHYKATYLNEYLAVGEAPEEIRNIFRQRSRWCKGQMQVLFSKHCPLFDIGLPMSMRLLYTSVTWSYITNTLAVPVAVFVPFIALVFGIYPLVLNQDFALAVTLYFAAGQAITNFCVSTKHIKPMWYCTVSCHLLWFTFTKATVNVLLNKIHLKRKVVFKSTKKKGEEDEASTKRRCCASIRTKNVGDMEGTKDVFVVFASFFFSFITCCVGVFQIVDKPYTAQGDFRWYLLLSVFWAIYNMMPPSLFIFYCYRKDRVFEEFCSFAMLISFLVAVGALACIWLVPTDYNMSQVLNNAMQFYEAQRSGKLPLNSDVPWAKSSGLYDSTILPSGKNYSLVGGWYDDGGFLKLGYSTAFTTSLIAWSIVDFGNGYTTGDNDNLGDATLRWGADYLMKCAVTNLTGSGTTMPDLFIAQVGDVKVDSLYWGPPETMPNLRPATFVNAAKPGSDVVGMASAALAASALAIRGTSALTSQLYLEKAVRLYKLATLNKGLYGKYIATGAPGGRYPSMSLLDDLAYAAAWLYRATNDPTYLNDAQTYWQQSLATEGHVNPNIYMFNYENVIPAVDMLLGILTEQPTYAVRVKDFAVTWLRGDKQNVLYTPKSLAIAQPYGTLQHTANAAFLVMLYAKYYVPDKVFLYACWARGQVGYMLGDAGRSFVVGYGNNYPLKVPHRGASCPDRNVADCTLETAYYSTDPNPETLRGAVVGGPDVADQWNDERDITSEANRVTLLNNAGFTVSLSGLTSFDINMAKCQQGNGFIQNIMLKMSGQPDISGQRWWNGLQST